MPTLDLLVIADDPLSRSGLVALFDEQDSLRIAAALSKNDSLLEALELHRPDLLVWDLGWDPEVDDPFQGLGDPADLPVPVLALAPADVSPIRFWRAGVTGLLPRSASRKSLLAAIPCVAAGLSVLHPLYRDVATAGAHLADNLLSIEPLTPREQEVLGLLAEGLTNRAIGRQLSISEHTAKFHVQALMGKLGAQSRTDVVVRAVRAGVMFL